MNEGQTAPASQRFSSLVPVVAFLLVSSVGYLVSFLFPNIISYLGCSRSNLLSGRIHTLVTYPFLHFSLAHLVSVGTSLLLSTYFIADMLTRRKIWALVCASSLLGAVLLCLMVKTGIFAGGVMITWGFAGAVLLLGTTHWRKLNLLRRVYLFFVGLFTVGMLVFNPSALSCIQVLVAAGAFAVVRFWIRSAKVTVVPNLNVGTNG